MSNPQFGQDFGGPDSINYQLLIVTWNKETG